jgi:hypothetical protein
VAIARFRGTAKAVPFVSFPNWHSLAKYSRACLASPRVGSNRIEAWREVVLEDGASGYWMTPATRSSAAQPLGFDSLILRGHSGLCLCLDFVIGTPSILVPGVVSVLLKASILSSVSSPHAGRMSGPSLPLPLSTKVKIPTSGKSGQRWGTRKSQNPQPLEKDARRVGHQVLRAVPIWELLPVFLRAGAGFACAISSQKFPIER